MDGKPSAHEVARRGIELAREALAARGARARPAGKGFSRNMLTVSLPDGRKALVYVKTRRVGDWQTSTNFGQPRSDESHDEFWLFVDLMGEPDFYVVPASWIENDIYRVHVEYLEKHGGRRRDNPASDHHRITEDRIARWRDCWDRLGLPVKPT